MKKLRQSILFAGASGKLTTNWRRNNPNVEPASKHLGPIIRKARSNHSTIGSNIEKLPKIPESWEWVPLKVISEIRGGITKGKNYKGKKTVQLPYLRVAKSKRDTWIYLK